MFRGIEANSVSAWQDVGRAKACGVFNPAKPDFAAPVAQHDATAIAAKFMHCRAMGVAMDHDIKIALIQHFQDFLGRDVHDVSSLVAVHAVALGARLFGEGAAFSQRFGEKLMLPLWIPHQVPELQVAGIPCAKHIAVQQQIVLALVMQHMGFMQQGGAGFGSKTLAQQEIAIAVQEVNSQSLPGLLLQGLCDNGVQGPVIVIPDPDIEKIAQDIESPGAWAFTPQEVEEGAGQIIPRLFKMQIGNQQYAISALHPLSTGFRPEACCRR